MSMNRSSDRPDDQIVNLLSQWLAGHVGNDELRREVEGVGTAELAPDQARAVDELLHALRLAAPGERGDLERVVRETFEALALG
jgi:hypothetical protein